MLVTKTASASFCIIYCTGQLQGAFSLNDQIILSYFTALK